MRAAPRLSMIVVPECAAAYKNFFQKLPLTERTMCASMQLRDVSQTMPCGFLIMRHGLLRLRRGVGLHPLMVYSTHSTLSQGHLKKIFVGGGALRHRKVEGRHAIGVKFCLSAKEKFTCWKVNPPKREKFNTITEIQKVFNI